VLQFKVAKLKHDKHGIEKNLHLYYIYIHIYIYTYTHTYIYIYVYIYIHSKWTVNKKMLFPDLPILFNYR